ncbi:hypothetical protein BS50DRAFT_637240 [Corynespora cassiicola Philippines]|uniref:BTB domain-containing protein n=1 Tax=Corynespora cassiicola Philippines TaxID=1448308 RepID=A0A2T2NEP0_CORCC|nr:hypothetical protein BS50DRAFT_637240 [Corynespora cassiicola Philippines]
MSSPTDALTYSILPNLGCDQFILLTEDKNDKFSRAGELVATEFDPEDSRDTNRQIFKVHRRMLLRYSQYFWDKLGGVWKPHAQETVLHLDHFKPSLFGIFLRWAYFGEALPENWITATVKSSNKLSQRGYDAYLIMLQAYTMAENLIAPESKWQIHEEFVKDYNGLVTEDTYRLASYASKNLPANSPIL